MCAAISKIRGPLFLDTMAERSRFFCSVCELEFHFSSRFQRHLISSAHRQLADSLLAITVDEHSRSVATSAVSLPTNDFRERSPISQPLDVEDLSENENVRVC